jgi:hypothetical protein
MGLRGRRKRENMAEKLQFRRMWEREGREDLEMKQRNERKGFIGENSRKLVGYGNFKTPGNMN